MRSMRIEQLGNEKERLDFERAFALKRAMGAPSSHPDQGEEGGEGEGEPAAIGSALETGDV